MDDRRRIELYVRLARLLRDRLNDAPGAVDAFRAALEIDPDHPESIAEIEALFEAQNKWHDLAEMLAQGQAAPGRLAAAPSAIATRSGPKRKRR